ncbi:MAG: 2'-5' RNA ligase family protein [Anaeroplasmataceae bacterium]|nr:2'-5' RNA ligase family protein [Anaeroplasmataceae bacterium]
MKKDKFLTVFAVLDTNAQERLTEWQNHIFEAGLVGTQTMGIPFHITLGSFPLDKAKELCDLIEQLSKMVKEFPIEFTEINDFGNKVLFLQPTRNEKLMQLYEKFNSNYADGLSYYPHTTIFCGAEAEVLKAKEILKQDFYPFTCSITEIHLGEFFPTKMILKSKLQA